MQEDIALKKKKSKVYTSHGFPFCISEKLLIPISKNENKPLQTLPSLAKPAAALQTFNNAILTPVSNNNTGFLRNLLNSSAGKVQEKFSATGLSWFQA